MPSAAIYVRLSRFRSGEPDIAPETQRRACQAYCEARGWSVSATYEDLDVSGGSLERPQLDRLRGEWQRYDHVVFHKLDRLSRSLSDFLTINKEAESAGVALVSVSDNLDMSTPMGRFVAQILAAFAEMERAMIIARTKAGKETSRSLGRWHGGTVPFGFSVEDSKLVVNEDQAEIIREVVRRKTGGEPWVSLVGWLLEVAPCRRWDSRAVRQILASERLRGTILTPGEWESAQALTKPLRRQDWTPRAPHLLSGMLRCGACDRVMGYQKARTSGRKNYRAMYRCTSLGCPGRVSVFAEEVEQHITRTFLRLFGDTAEVEFHYEADVRAERLAELKAELRELDANLSSLDVDHLLAAATRKRELLQQVSGLEGKTSAATSAVPTGRTLGEAWGQQDTLGRRALLLKHLAPSGILVTATGRSQFTPDRLSIVEIEQDVDELLGV